MKAYKLIYRNLVRNVRDYLIYFMTLVISISVFYAFNAALQSGALESINADFRQLTKTISSTLTVLSRMISILIGFLILYVNRFLLKRRNKELGMYMLLGMKKQKISMIFIGETFMVGLLSLVTGILAGTFLAQLLAIACLRVFGGQVSDFTLSFSVDALKNTLLCFGIIYFLAMTLNLVTVSKVKLIDLLTAERRNEELKKSGNAAVVISFAAGILCLVLSALMLKTKDVFPDTNRMVCGVALIVAATVLIFYSAAVIFLLLVRKNRKFYFKGINCFIVRQVGSRIKGNFLSMSVVCLLLTVTILLITTSTSIAITMANLSKDFTPYDFVLSYEGEDPDVVHAAANYEYPSDLSAIIGTSFQIEDKCANDLTYKQLFEGQETQFWDVDRVLPECSVCILSISDYNKCLMAQGYPAVELPEDAFVINCNYKGTYEYVKYFADHSDSLTVNGKKLRLADKEIKGYVYEMTSVSNNDRGTLIVPDAVAALSETDQYTLQGFWKEGTDTDYANSMLNRLVEHDLDHTPFGWTSKARIYTMYYLAFGLPVYEFSYLGIIFLLVSVALISVQQLTQMSDNRIRYRILKNQGVSDQMMKSAVARQVGVYFAAPLVLAVFYTVLSLQVVMEKVSTFYNMEIRASMIVTFFALLLIYGGYYLATSASCKRMVFHGKG